MDKDKNPSYKHVHVCAPSCGGCKCKNYDRREYDGYNVGINTEPGAVA